MNKIVENLNAIIVELKDEKIISTKNISDKWHTFEDLYNHRMAFNIALCNMLRKRNGLEEALYNEFPSSVTPYEPHTYCYKSKRHHDNENDPMFEGSFIVVIESPNGQISYHYKLAEWDKFKIEEREEANKYDGHTPEDTIKRLISLF